MNARETQLEQNAPLKNYCTLRIGGEAAYLAHAKTMEQVVEVHQWAHSQKLPILVIGGGSNVIFSDEPFKGLIIRVEIPGFEVIKEDDHNSWIKIGAGENWDQTVGRVVDMGLAGVEAMSLIPGTVGATPVQNVGAYGQEIKDVLESVEAYDAQEDKMVTLSNSDCQFAYRDSIFKSGQKGRYIIGSITIKLSKTGPNPPTYASLKKRLDELGITEPSLMQIRNAVIDIRQHKLPDPSERPNAGSFFKNPIISAAEFSELKLRFTEMNGHELADGRVKLAAGWLMEQTGLKGWRYKNLGIYELNSLVVVNYGDSSYQDLMELKEQVVEKVKAKFGIELVQEPQVLFA